MDPRRGFVVCPKCGAAFRPEAVPKRDQAAARKRLTRALESLRRTMNGQPPADGADGPIPGEQLRLFL
jgi:uncharacterized Zn finger protein (UPF0148 family)